MINEDRKEDHFIPKDKNPYNPLIGEWVRIISGGNGQSGVYVSLTKSKLHVLRPYLSNETYPDNPDRMQTNNFVILDMPAFVSDTPDLTMIPMRKKYVEGLLNGGLEGKTLDKEC